MIGHRRADQEPEAGHFGLLRSSLRADLPTGVLELIVVSRPFLLSSEIGGRRRNEMGYQDERLHVRPH